MGLNMLPHLLRTWHTTETLLARRLFNVGMISIGHEDIARISPIFSPGGPIRVPRISTQTQTDIDSSLIAH